MGKVIAQFSLFISKNLWIMAIIGFHGCQKEIKPIPLSLLSSSSVQIESGEELKVRMALTTQQQVQGLSGVQDYEFRDDEAMLFFNLEDSLRQFWMPDTYFNLDIFFLDRNLVVLDVDRDVPHYIGRENPEKIPRAKPVYCRHVFEMKASSALSKKIQKGMKLKWTGKFPLEQIELSIRQLQ